MHFRILKVQILKTCMQHTEKAVAPQSSPLAWKIPWMEEPGRLQSMGLLRVGHDWVTSLSLFTLMHWRRKWQPTPMFLSGESQGQGSLVGCHLWGCTVGHDWSDLATAVEDLSIKLITDLKNYLFAIQVLICSIPTLSCHIWDLVPWPWIESGPPALGAWSLSHWTTREFPAWFWF